MMEVIVDEKKFDLICTLERGNIINPLTLEFEPHFSLTKEQKNWPVFLINANIYEKGSLLLDHGITEWVWENAAPERMVHRINIYFKNDFDYIFAKMMLSDYIIIPYISY